jgi:uncharacterized membrane protein
LTAVLKKPRNADLEQKQAQTAKSSFEKSGFASFACFCLIIPLLLVCPDGASSSETPPTIDAPAALASTDAAAKSMLGGYRPAHSGFPRPVQRRPVSGPTLLWTAILLAALGTVTVHSRRYAHAHRAARERLPRLARWEWIVLYGLTAAAACVFIIPSYWRYMRYGIDSYDIGIYTHAFWNALQGYGMFNSPEGLDHLNCHASPGLYLLLPAYALIPDSFTLLVLNSVALAIGAIPAYLIARRRLGSPTSFCCAAIYLVNPALRSLNYDVHEVTFAVPLLLWAMLFIQLRRTAPMLVALVLAMMFKEDIGIVVSFCGLYVAAFQRRVHLGVAMVLLGMLWVVVGIGVIVPYFGGDHASGYFDRYRALGDTWIEVVLSPLLRPGALMAIASSATTQRYLVMVLAPFAFLPVLAPAELILALAPFAVNVLSQDEVMRSGTYHYEALLLPGLYVAFVATVTRLSALALGDSLHAAPPRRRAVAVTLTVALGALVGANLRLNQTIGRPLLLGVDGDPARAELDAIVARVPPDVPAVSPQHVQPHLSNRRVSVYLNNVDDFSNDHPPFHYAVVPNTAQPPPATYELEWQGAVYSLYRLRAAP